MSRRKFLKEAGVLKLEVEGNTLTGEPRSFKSDAMGWCAAKPRLRRVSAPCC